MFENSIKSDKKLKRQYSYNDIVNKNWKKNNDVKVDIIKRIKNMQSKVKFSYCQLLDENNVRDFYYKTLNTSSEEKRRKKKKKTIDNISPLAKRFIKKTNNKINKVNQSTLDIVKLNYLYYLNKPQKNVSKSCDEKSRNKFNRVKSSIDNTNEDNLLKKLNSKSLIKNFVYINNNFHKQINNAFMKYNPTSHLNNMKILLEAVPSFHEDISRVKDEVENDINFKCDKYKFKKKYLNYKNKQNLLSVNQPNLKNEPNLKKNANKIVSLPKIRMNDENKKVNIHLFFINKLKKNRGQDFKKLKQNKISEINRLISISGNINNLIEKDAIENKIKKYIEDYNIVKYNAEINKNNDFKIDLNKIDYFRKEKSTIDKKLESFYLNKYFNSIDKQENNLFNKLNSELDVFTNKNINNRDSSLNELDNFLIQNEINILEQQKK